MFVSRLGFLNTNGVAFLFFWRSAPVFVVGGKERDRGDRGASGDSRYDARREGTTRRTDIELIRVQQVRSGCQMRGSG